MGSVAGGHGAGGDSSASPRGAPGTPGRPHPPQTSLGARRVEPLSRTPRLPRTHLPSPVAPPSPPTGGPARSRGARGVQGRPPRGGDCRGGGPAPRFAGIALGGAGTRCVQADVRSISIGGRGERDRAVTTAERERARASRRAGSRRAGGEPQRPGRPRSGERGPRLRDPGRPRALPSGRAHAAPRTDVPGKSRPGRGHPARATRGPERSRAPTTRGHPGGPGARADAGSLTWDALTFWARRSQPGKLSAGRSPRWGSGLRKSTCVGTTRSVPGEVS